jgi:hypothetical protein
MTNSTPTRLLFRKKINETGKARTQGLTRFMQRRKSKAYLKVGWGTWIRTKTDGVGVRSDRSRSWRPSPSGPSTRFTVLLHARLAVLRLSQLRLIGLGGVLDVIVQGRRDQAHWLGDLDSNQD